MKKALAAMVLFVLVAVLSTNTVFAEDLGSSVSFPSAEETEAETEQTEAPSQTSILDDMADPPDAIAGSAEESELMPIEVTQSTDGMEIRKVYELSPDTDPERLPRADFERNGAIYSCVDIMREVLIGDEFKAMAVSETKDYPNLSSNDPYHVPKTLDDNGRALQLQGIEWKGENLYAASDESGGFTAVATYGGVKVSEYVESYVISADYTGEVSRKGVDVIRYTVIFGGAAATTPEPASETPSSPETASASGGGSGGWIIALIILLLAGGGVAAYFLLGKKGGPGYAAEPDYSQSEYYPADDEAPDIEGDDTRD